MEHHWHCFVTLVLALTITTQLVQAMCPAQCVCTNKTVHCQGIKYLLITPWSIFWQITFYFCSTTIFLETKLTFCSVQLVILKLFTGSLKYLCAENYIHSSNGFEGLLKFIILIKSLRILHLKFSLSSQNNWK